MANITHRLSAFDLENGFQKGTQWQVVYKTFKGQDYCRETYSATNTLADVESIAAEECAAHGLAGAEIQRW